MKIRKHSGYRMLRTSEEYYDCEKIIGKEGPDNQVCFIGPKHSFFESSRIHTNTHNTHITHANTKGSLSPYPLMDIKRKSRHIFASCLYIFRLTTARPKIYVRQVFRDELICGCFHFPSHLLFVFLFLFTFFFFFLLRVYLIPR